jgi:hypothetical protein
MAAEEKAERKITCFYQFGKAALEALAGPEGLPNGPQYLHLFSHSHPGMNPHPDTANMVRAKGASFKYALALDVHKYKGWQQATDEQLQGWAKEFREQALDARGPADYFAFNEMPTTGASAPALRGRAITWLHALHDAGGGPKLRGVFYFTERNLNPQNWMGEADDFWQALDETCDLVVGEHYHSYEFIFSHTPESLANHLFALPKWLREGEAPAEPRHGKPAQVAIAEQKYAVLHSSFYGPMLRGWAGVENGKHDLADLEKYCRFLLEATRRSEFGKRRVAFGPLATQNFDPQVLPVLARALGKDLRGS